MEPEEIQTKLFELGELFGNSLVSSQFGDLQKAKEFKTAAESILAEFAEMSAHIEIFCEKQYQMPGGRRNKCRAEEIIKRCHGGEIHLWVSIAVVLDETQGHPVARLGDIDTHFEPNYEYDDCDDEDENEDEGGDNGKDKINTDEDPGQNEPDKKFSDDDFLRRYNIKPPDEETKTA